MLCDRLCDPVEVPLWLQAIKMEIFHGWESILQIFEKKAIGNTRKRKLLTFGVEMTPEKCAEKDSPIEEVIQFENSSFPSHSLLDLKKTVDYNAKVILYDFMKHPQTLAVAQNSPVFDELKKESNVMMIPMLKTPEKINRTCQELITPVKPYSPSRRVMSLTGFLKSKLNSPRGKFQVATLRSAGLNFISTNFTREAESSDQARHMMESFEATVKQIFPWFYDNSFHELEYNDSSGMAIEDSVEDNICSESIEVPEDFDPFVDTFWNEEYIKDKRECVLCAKRGDCPAGAEGRLLCMGPKEWVHVNCIIWSSQVWEREDGALQDVREMC